MATNKTIDPTNVTVQVPAMADKPNQAGNSNCIDKIIDGLNALNSKISVVLFDNSEGTTGLNVDFSKYNTFIITLANNVTVLARMVGVADAEFYGANGLYASSSAPFVMKNICFKVNNTGTGFYINTSKSYQINVSSQGAVSVYNITDNKFYKVIGIPN